MPQGRSAQLKHGEIKLHPVHVLKPPLDSSAFSTGSFTQTGGHCHFSYIVGEFVCFLHAPSGTSFRHPEPVAPNMLPGWFEAALLLLAASAGKQVTDYAVMTNQNI